MIDTNTSDESNSPVPCCLNCRRCLPTSNEDDNGYTGSEYEKYSQLQLESVPITDIHFTYKSSHLQRASVTGDAVMLCWQCYNALCRSGSDQSHRSFLFCWPSFIWSMLKNTNTQSSHGADVWQLLPLEWRRWWLPAAEQLQGMEDVEVETPPPYVVEISSTFKAVSAAIKNNQWVELGKACNEYLVVPTVKCPWGCSQFMNLATETVPLDIIYLEFLDYPVKVLRFTPAGKSKFISGVRPHFLQSRHAILANPSPGWACSPSVIFKENKGPMIATCGYHSARTKGRYVHPPRSPLGTTSTGSADQFASAVVHPRTVAFAQRREYSDRYHVAKMSGRYEGVDSFTLCNQGNYSIANTISIKQDALAIATRPDVSATVKWLADDGSIPQSLCDVKHDQSQELYPHDAIQSIKAEYETDTTYVPAQEALQLEHALKLETATVISVKEKDLEDIHDVHFTPSWPKQVIHIHPCNKHGSRPTSIPIVNDQPFTDSRGLWVALALCIHNPVLWKSLCDRVQNNWEWHGWFLAYCIKHCLNEYQRLGSRNDPFRSSMKPEDLLDMMFGQHHNAFYTPMACTTTLFGDLPKVKVISSTILWEAIGPGRSVDVDPTTEMLLVYSSLSPPNQAFQPPQRLAFGDPAGSKKCCWELRHIVAFHTAGERGTIYFRHGGNNHPSWWCQEKEAATYMFRRLDDLPHDINGWDTSVYVKCNDPVSLQTKLAEQYLALTGGQTTVRCRIHEVFLVRSNLRSKELCCRCNITPPEYECPYSNCTVALCRSHFRSVTGDSDDNVNALQILPIVIEGMESLGTEGAETTDNHIDNSSSSSSNGTDTNISASDGESNYDDQNSEDSIDFDDSDDERSPFLDNDDVLHIGNDDTNSCWFEADILDPENIAFVENDVSSYVNALEDDIQSTAEPCNIANLQDVITHLEETADGDDVSASEEGSDTESSSDQSIAGLLPDVNHSDCYDFARHGHLASHDTSTYTFEREFIGGHVLLNKHARLLVRKRAKLVLTRQQQGFLQKMVATTTHSTPLLYAEGALFYSIFWDSMKDGSIVGALPCSFLCGNDVLRRNNVAPLLDQLRTRLMNTELLCASDYRYHFFCLDQLVNLGMRRHDTRIVLSRGFGEQQGSSGIRMIPEDERIFYQTENIDSRPVVHKLGTAIGVKMATLFYTHSCSMKNHFIMKHLKNWIDSPEATIETAKTLGLDRKDLGEAEKNMVHYNLVASACSIFLRAWDNAVNIWLHYIFTSPEQPAGEVYWNFTKKELQNRVANLYHTHSILWCREDDGTPEGTQKIVNRIRASTNDIVTHDEFLKYKAEGVFSSYECLVELLEGLRKKLLHKHHSRCLVRRKGSFYAIAPDFTLLRHDKYLGCKRIKFVVNDQIRTLTTK